jgi:hypothetical protein
MFRSHGLSSWPARAFLLSIMPQSAGLRAASCQDPDLRRAASCQDQDPALDSPAAVASRLMFPAVQPLSVFIAWL